MANPKKINPADAVREIREAAERRSNRTVDLSRISEYKTLFMQCAVAVCPGFTVREEMKPAYNDIVHWAVMDYDGNRYYFRIDNVIDVCAAYADESIYGGYRGIRQYIDSPRQAFDELGSETVPTGRYGNFENVMQYIFQSRYDNRYHQFTHATTNFTIDQIQDVYGERIYDRFKEMFNFVALRGKTFRINTQKNMEK